MPIFVKEHCKRIFADAGFGLLEAFGDRHGIVQGDGLDVKVAPFIEPAAQAFTEDAAVRAAIMDKAINGEPLKLRAFGGSISVDDGYYGDLPTDFIEFLKDRCRDAYWQAQKDVDAYYEAGDPEDMEWNERLNAYVGIIDQFTAFLPDGPIFIRVVHVADEEYNPYESGEEEYDRAEAAEVIAGKHNHGSILIESFDEEKYAGAIGSGQRIAFEHGVSWQANQYKAGALDIASDIVEDDETIAEVIAERAKIFAADTSETPTCGM